MFRPNYTFRSLCARLIVLLGLFVSISATAESRNGFLLDDALIPTQEIRSGGPPRDGIPSLDNPLFVTADKARFLRPNDRILGVELNGIERAYPIRILNFHEIVNDIIDGQPLVITYCPLCGSGMAFESTIDGKHLKFGVSGLLYNSDVLLYDRQSASLWSQIAKTAVTGKMKGTKLNAIPVAHTTWRDWRTRHPETKVLSTETGFRRNYKVDPYPNYGRDRRLYFPVAQEDRRYSRKAMVMGLETGGQFKAYPFSELKKSASQFTDTFQGQQFEVYYDNRNQTARILDANGDEIPTLIAFWFAWYAFHPGTEVYTAK